MTAKARRDELRGIRLCINGWAHGPRGKRCGGRCKRCYLVKLRGLSHPDVARYDASRAGRRWWRAKLDLYVMARAGELGARLPGRRTPPTPSRPERW